MDSKLVRTFIWFLFDGDKIMMLFFSKVFLFVLIAVAYTFAGPISTPLGRDCIQIGNKEGRDFTLHMCPLNWYVAGLQFVGHQNGESAYAISCCQNV